MTQASTEDIVPVVITATQEVFSTMLGLQVRAGEARQAAISTKNFDGVVALVGVGGPWTGLGRISGSSEFACKMAGALLGAQCENMDEDVLDAVAEIANMIIGNVKTAFEECLGPLALSVPTVVFGRNYQTRCSGAREWTVVPFECEGHAMEVCFFLMKSAAQHHVPVRSDLCV